MDLLAHKLRKVCQRWIRECEKLPVLTDQVTYSGKELKRIQRLITRLRAATDARNSEGVVAMLDIFCEFWGRISILLHRDATAGLRQLDWRREITAGVKARRDLFPSDFLEDVRSHGGATEGRLTSQKAAWPRGQHG